MTNEALKKKQDAVESTLVTVKAALSRDIKNHALAVLLSQYELIVATLEVARRLPPPLDDER